MLTLREMCASIKKNSWPERQYTLMKWQVRKMCCDGYITYKESLRMEQELLNAYKEALKHGY